MVYCKIKNGLTKKGEGTFFQVPHDHELRKQWIRQIETHQEFDPIPAAYPICLLHFEPSKIVLHGKRTTLIKGTLPTVFPSFVGEFEEKLQHVIEEPFSGQQTESVIKPITELKSETVTDVITDTASEPQQQLVIESAEKQMKQKEIIGNVQRSHTTVSITSEEYIRLMKTEVQMQKFKVSCQNKSNEIKRLRTQLAYCKKQISILRKIQTNDDDNEKKNGHIY